MNNKFLVIFVALCLFPFVTADSIDELRVDSTIELGKNLTVYGKYSDGGGYLCSFYIFDPNDENQLLERLSDEYTQNDGYFSAVPFKLTEPVFKRGNDYNVFVCCNTACDSNVFYVGQKEDIAFGLTSEAMLNDLVFWTNPENSVVTVFWLFFILLIAVVVAVFVVPIMRAYGI